MSKISECYEELRTLVGTVFPNHVELVNPYQIELNDDITFEKAYGIAFAEGFNTNREIGCSLTIQRNFIFTLTRKIFAGPMRTAEALSERREKEKQLFEDQFDIIKKFEQDTFVNNYVNIALVRYESDSGIEFIRAGQFDLVMLRSIFVLEYFQEVNT